MTPFLRAAIGALALSASPLLAQTPTCVAHIDTLRDTIYAILTPGHPTDEVAPAALTPVVRALTNAEDGMRMIGVVSLGAGPTGPILDLRVGGPPQPLPPAMTELPGPWAFTLHRNGTITGAHALTPSRPISLLACCVRFVLSVSAHLMYLVSVKICEVRVKVSPGGQLSGRPKALTRHALNFLRRSWANVEADHP